MPLLYLLLASLIGFLSLRLLMFLILLLLEFLAFLLLLGVDLLLLLLIFLVCFGISRISGSGPLQGRKIVGMGHRALIVAGTGSRFIEPPPIVCRFVGAGWATSCLAIRRRMIRCSCFPGLYDSRSSEICRLWCCSNIRLTVVD